MKNNLSAFGQKLKEIRKNLGLTQDDVVQKTNGNISRRISNLIICACFC